MRARTSFPTHPTVRLLGGIALSLTLAHNIGSAQDTVEFLSGATVEGTVKNIDKTKKSFEFETTVGDRTFTQSYPFGKVHAVTLRGKRHELTPKPASDGSNGDVIDRTEDELQAFITEAGRTLPDWFESTKLDYPETLDLSWPLGSTDDGWKSHKYMNHYLWSVVNENPSRWRSGIKLVHHCMTLHEGNSSLLDRDMEKLGSMYFTLLQDHAHAAYWFQKAKVSVTQLSGIRLAECYWRLGNRQLALDTMRGKLLAIDAIKLLGDMGEIEAAMQVASVYEQTTIASQASLLAGDALRQAGRNDEAIKHYQRAVDGKNFRNEEYARRFRGRAKDSIEAIRLYDQLDLSQVADGTHASSSVGYNGKVNVDVRVSAGRIENVRVTSHNEKQFYAALTDTPKQITAKQTVLDIDATSGATITSQAIINATAKALAEARK